MIKIEIVDRESLENWYLDRICVKRRVGITGNSHAQKLFKYFNDNIAKIILGKS